MSYEFRIEDEKIFAIVEFWDDELCNENQKEIIIFNNYEDYLDAIDMWNRDQEFTGCGWYTLYRRIIK